MALQGTYIHHYQEAHPSNLVDYTVTYPADLSEDHPDYDKRGTTETQQTLEILDKTITYENCYIMVETTSIVPLYIGASEKTIELSFFYRVYESEDARTNTPDVFTKYLHIVPFDFTGETNSFSEAYNQILLLPGAENLTSI